jgi:hypothetical protein
MNRHEFMSALEDLRLSPKEAAELLGYELRTIRRWQEGDGAVPAAPAAALRAWSRLEQYGLPWRPGAAVIGLTEEQASEQVRLYRQHAQALDAVLSSVQARGGPAVQWSVDLGKNVAKLGGVEVHFYRLANEGFSLNTYSRKDKEPDYERDRPLIEDATVCIAEAIAAEAADKKAIPILTPDQAEKMGVHRQYEVLVADVTPLPHRPGWVDVQGEIWEPYGPENDNYSQTPLLPQPREMRRIYLEEVLRKKAKEKRVRFIVVNQKIPGQRE